MLDWHNQRHSPRLLRRPVETARSGKCANEDPTDRSRGGHRRRRSLDWFPGHERTESTSRGGDRYSTSPCPVDTMPSPSAAAFGMATHPTVYCSERSGRTSRPRKGLSCDGVDVSHRSTGSSAVPIHEHIPARAIGTDYATASTMLGDAGAQQTIEPKTLVWVITVDPAPGQTLTAMHTQPQSYGRSYQVAPTFPGAPQGVGTGASLHRSLVGKTSTCRSGTGMVRSRADASSFGGRWLGRD